MQYRRLNTNNGEIRLLRIHKRQVASDPLECTVEHALLLGDVVDYVALSYLWGDENQTKAVLVDGEVFQATQNLADALDALEMRGVRLVWADALCINQADDEEKSRQIPLMGAIFRSAKRTVAYLPNVAKDVNDPMYFLRSIQRSSFDIDEDPLFKYDLEASLHFFDNPFLRRLWVFQELALSRRVDFVYGPHTISIAELETAKYSDASQSHLITSRLQENFGFQHLQNILRLRPRFEQGQTIPLVEALVLTSASRSGKARDRVFGLWALSYDIQFYIRVPSYTIPESDLCLIMTKEHIRMKGSLDLVAILGNKVYSEDLPTWVPNWFSGDTWSNPRAACLVPASNYPGQAHLAKYTTTPQRYEALAATRGWPLWDAAAKTKPAFKIQDHQILKVKGLILGTIADCSRTHRRERLRHGYDATPPAWLADRGSQSEALWDLLSLFSRGANDDPSSREDPYFQGLFGTASRRIRTDVYWWVVFAVDPGEISSLIKWIQLNANFLIFNEKISKLLLGDGLDKSYFFAKIFRLVGWIKLLELLGLERLSSRRHLADKPGYADKLSKMTEVIKLGMRLAYGTFGLAWVDEKAKSGDRIAILTGCSIPVVLRDRRQGGYSLIGDAIVAKAMAGERMDEAKCKYLKIY